MKYSPTPQQEEVIQADDDILVVGRPGSGKTTVALEKARLFLADQELSPGQRVLFLSFSNAAVHRIRSEARVSLQRDIRRQLEITTFHAFCYHFLQSHRRLAGLRARFQLHPPENEDLLRSFVPDQAELAEKLRKLEVEEGLVCFDRFAELTCKVLESVPALRKAYAKAYPLVIADEYQDTADDQHRLVQALRFPGQLVCLGDPEQRIYDWRGGSPADRLERLEQDGFRRIELKSNHRSDSTDVLDVARAVLGGAQSISTPTSVKERKYGDYENLEAILKQEILSLSSHVRRVRGDGEVTLAIMTYTNRFVHTLSRMLSRPGGGFEHPFRHRVLIRPEAVGFAWGAVMDALAATSPKVCAAALLRGAAKLHRVKGGSSALSNANRLERWATDIETESLSGKAKGATMLYKRIEALDEWSGDPVTDIRRVCVAISDLPGGHLDPITRVLELRPLDHPASELSRRLSTSFARHGSYEGAPQQAEACLLVERMSTAAELGPSRILMTLHKCKGKEFDGVILVNGRGTDSLLVWKDRGPRYPRSRRLLHVGLTRARYGVRFLTPWGEDLPIWPRFE